MLVGVVLVTNSRLTPLMVLAGIIDPDFIKKTNKWGRVPNSRITHFPVPSGLLYPDFTKKTNKGGMGTELEASALGGTSGNHRSRLYKKNKADAATAIRDNALAGTVGNSRSPTLSKSL